MIQNFRVLEFTRVFIHSCPFVKFSIPSYTLLNILIIVILKSMADHSRGESFVSTFLLSTFSLGPA